MADKFRAVVFPIVLVMGAFIFLATGIYIGYEFARMRGESSAWSCLTSSAEDYVRALQRLRSGKLEDAIGGLEASLDVRVLFMSRSGQKDVEETLVRVKKYRTQYPWSGSTPEMNARVAKALSEVQ